MKLRWLFFIVVISLGFILFFITTSYIVKTSQDILVNEQINDLENSLTLYKSLIDNHFTNLKKIIEISNEEELKNLNEPYEILFLDNSGRLKFSKSNLVKLNTSFSEKDFFKNIENGFYFGSPEKDEKFNTTSVIIAKRFSGGNIGVFFISFDKLNNFLNESIKEDKIYLLDEENNLIISNKKIAREISFENFCVNDFDILETKNLILVSSRADFTGYCVVIESKKTTIYHHLNKKEIFSISFSVLLIIIFSLFAYYIGRIFEKESLYYK